MHLHTTSDVREKRQQQNTYDSSFLAHLPAVGTLTLCMPLIMKQDVGIWHTASALASKRLGATLMECKSFFDQVLQAAGLLMLPW